MVGTRIALSVGGADIWRPLALPSMAAPGNDQMSPAATPTRPRAVSCLLDRVLPTFQRMIGARIAPSVGGADIWRHRSAARPQAPSATTVTVTEASTPGMSFTSTL